MYGRIIDESNPRYRGPLPKPRGLLPLPPEIAEEVSREQASEQPYYTDDYAKLTRDDWTLTYYYEGETVASRSTPEGVEVDRAVVRSKDRQAVFGIPHVVEVSGKTE